MLSKEKMEELLTVRGETSTQDYKLMFPPKGHKNCEFLKLLRHIVAFANVGGGVIVFGVDDEKYEPVGIQGPRTLDDTDIHTALANYVDAKLDTVLTFYKWKQKDFAFLTIPAATWPLFFHKPASCGNCGANAPVRHFH